MDLIFSWDPAVTDLAVYEPMRGQYETRNLIVNYNDYGIL